MNDKAKQILDVLKNTAIDLTFQAASNALGIFVARKVNWYMDEEDQKRLQKQEQVPPPERKRIGFSNNA